MFILDEGYTCGIPTEITNTIGAVYNILLIAVPIIVVLFGIIDFIKAAMSGKEDEIKKNTNTFVKRVIIGLLVFFVLAVVKLVINVIQTNNTNGVTDCLTTIFGNKTNNNG